MSSCENRAVPRPLVAATGFVAYLASVGSMAAFAPFLAGVILPRTVDRGPVGSVSTALAVDLALLLGFALVHSGLARRPVRAALARRLPAGLERAAFSLVAAAQMCALLALWRPLPATVWRLEHPVARAAVWAAFGAGWALVLAGFAVLDGARLFGLAQARAAAQSAREPDSPFVVRGIYRYLRHPLYAGTVLALWAAPTMSAGHLLLAAFLTLYVAIGSRFEDRDLLSRFGESFRSYRAAVPGFLPRRTRLPAPLRVRRGAGATQPGY
jgi:protein-S-isoprenylcysteine O-methyltransferase Ste14